MPQNIHASAVVLGDRGIVIVGSSGMGKTQLALTLICHARSFGWFARLVADDQVLLSAHGGRVICAAPATIAGLVEVRGVGPWPAACEMKVPADLVVRLVERHVAERFPETATEPLRTHDGAAVVERIPHMAPEDFGTESPGLEIAQMRHERQRARMFLS